VTTLSATYFAVPLTGEFTDVSSEEQQTLGFPRYGSVIRADL